MKKSTVNLELQDSLDYSNNTEGSSELEGLPKEIQNKINLIKKAFK